MSTRATYSIENTMSAGYYSGYRGRLTYYVHHDGYPEGAAHKFLHLINQEGFIGHEGFIKNLPASLTNGHESIGDSEFRYDIKISEKNTTVTVYKGYERGEGFGLEGTYSLTEFIQKNTGIVVKNRMSWDNKPIQNNFVTLESLTHKLEKKQKENKAYKKAHPQAAGNINAGEREEERLKEQIENFFANEAEKESNVKHYTNHLKQCVENPFFMPAKMTVEKVEKFLEQFQKEMTNYQLGKAIVKVEKAFS